MAELRNQSWIMASNPFQKLVELGFKGTTQLAAEAAAKRKVEGSQVAQPVQPKPKRKKKKKKPATDPALAVAEASTTLARAEKKAKKRKKSKQSGAPRLVASLPNASFLTPQGFKKVPYAATSRSRLGTKTASAKASEPKTAKVASGKKPAKAKQPKQGSRSSKPLPFTPNLMLDPIFLRRRTMAELQQVWMNVLHYLEVRPKLRVELLKHRDAIVKEWARRHQVALNDPDHFVWPSTNVGAGGGSQQFDNWHAQGMLGYLGYHVGATNGVSEFARREILDMVFSSVLPPVNGVSYVRGWGEPSTSSRLHRLADEIARHARNGKLKRSADMSGPVMAWEADLKYLYRKYYVDKFGFGWPLLA